MILGPTMYEFLFRADSPLYPFVVAAAILVAFLMIEMLLAFIVGFSLLGMEFDADVDVDVDADVDMTIPDIDADIVTALDPDSSVEGAPDGLAGILRWFEIGSVPIMIWIVAFLASFASLGFFVQFTLLGFLGFTMPQLMASAILFFPALVATKWISLAFATIVPKTTTDVVSRRSIGGSVGRITVGTATAELPARAEVRDRHGALHNLRVVPFAGEPPLTQGTEILILRGPGPVYDALSIETARARLQTLS